jgi:hypothetical protein
MYTCLRHGNGEPEAHRSNESDDDTEKEYDKK